MLKIISFLSAAIQLSLLVILLINCYNSSDVCVYPAYTAPPWYQSLAWNATVLIPLAVGCAVSLIPFRKGLQSYSSFQRCFLYGTIVGATLWFFVINLLPKD
ncbi:MAG: hypothetical protein EOO88_59215 [Pedobacter sp.]|nr:MAG: hypothetical protein EOO88_59215 [Pedobacter sp.]